MLVFHYLTSVDIDLSPNFSQLCALVSSVNLDDASIFAEIDHPVQWLQSRCECRLQYKVTLCSIYCTA